MLMSEIRTWFEWFGCAVNARVISTVAGEDIYSVDGYSNVATMLNLINMYIGLYLVKRLIPITLSRDGAFSIAIKAAMSSKMKIWRSVPCCTLNCTGELKL